jgi:hypothetical protein
MNAQNGLRAIDIHSHWSTRRGYPLQTEAELAQQERTWRSKPQYRSEAEMAEDFRRAGVRVILDFGYTKYLPLDQVSEIHDYGFAVQETHSDVVIGNWVHFQPELGAPALAEFCRCLDRAAGFVGLAVSGSGGVPASDPAWEPFYRLCIEAKVPALILGCPAVTVSSSIPVILAIWTRSPLALPISRLLRRGRPGRGRAR